MKQRDRGNSKKWEAVAEYLLALSKGQALSIAFIAVAYDISASSISYGLARLLHPKAKDVTKIQTQGTIIFKDLAKQKQLTPEYIATFYQRCRIPIPANLKKAMTENTSVKTVPIKTTPEPKHTELDKQLCSNCKTAIIPHAAFCYRCGKPVPVSAEKIIDICDCLQAAMLTIYEAKPEKATPWCNAIAEIKRFVEEVQDGKKN